MAAYGIVVYWPDQPTASEQILLHAVAFPATFEKGLLDSRALLDTPADAFTTYSIQHNGVEKATVTFPETSSIGLFSCPETWEVQPGDRIQIIAPEYPDSAAAGVAITLIGYRQEPLSLSATLTATAEIEATMDHVFLFATLEAEADVTKAKLNLGNLFPQTILYADAQIATAYLTEVFSFRATLSTEGETEINAFLTVIHDESLFR